MQQRGEDVDVVSRVHPTLCERCWASSRGAIGSALDLGKAATLSGATAKAYDTHSDMRRC